jgi:hypothetical protein
MATSDMRKSVRLNPMVKILVLVACGIMAIHVLTLILAYGFGRDHLNGLRDLFDVDKERNVPAMFSFCLLLIASVVLAMIAYRQKPGDVPRAGMWAGLSAVFLYLALDEGLELHERVAHVTADMLGGGRLLDYAWVIPYAVFVLVFFLMYRRFLGQLPAETRRGFLIAGAIFVGGAFVTELFAAFYLYVRRTEKELGYDLLSALEETLEMTGVIFFIYTLTRYLNRQRPAAHAELVNHPS